MTEQQCNNCQFWREYPGAMAGSGDCRRRVPSMSRWPQTRLDDWCGEYEPKVMPAVVNVEQPQPKFTQKMP